MTDPPTLAELAAKAGNTGIVCPQCGGTSLPVLYTRRIGSEMARIRQCRVCGKKLFCKERIVSEK